MSPRDHDHEFILVATRPDGTRIYGCVGCPKAKTVMTTGALEAMACNVQSPGGEVA